MYVWAGCAELSFDVDRLGYITATHWTSRKKENVNIGAFLPDIYVQGRIRDVEEDYT
jgi:hypothetical protein